tara:strand:+ start:2331 stop:3407 length:1077 start_codon:yes stop_codon:yes gene_type:complete
MARALGLANLLDHQVGGRRNLIINGAMQVAQRGPSEPGITTSGYYTVDRHNLFLSGLGTWTQTQETDAPDGFANSLKLKCTTADASPAAGDALFVMHKLEGQDLQHLKKGTSSAESVTASFWVKSNKTGTYVFELLDQDNSARHINKSFTVDASGTWEYKTITFEGDATGAFDNDNEASLQISIWLGGGSNYNSGTLQTSWGALSQTNRAVGNVNLADALDNYFQITGVQLEVGETATPFEHRSYGEELALCQRYYYKIGISGNTAGIGWFYTNANAYLNIYSPHGMRTSAPSLETPNVTNGYTLFSNAGSSSTDELRVSNMGMFNSEVYNFGMSGTAGEAGQWVLSNGAYIALEDEI